MQSTDESPAPHPDAGARLGQIGRLPIVVVRVLQFALDLAVLALLCLVPLSVVLLLPRNPDDTLGNLMVSIPVIGLALLACVVLSWWCFVGRPARNGGRTYAMGWLRVHVVRADGTAASSGTLALRWIMLLVDGMLFGAVGLVAMLLTPRHQRIGDWVADTVVVRVRAGHVAPADLTGPAGEPAPRPGDGSPPVTARPT